MVDIYQNVSFKTSENVTKVYSTSFSLAVSMLNPEIRKAIYSIYGFVRIADEIVDSFLDADQEALLDELTLNLDSAIKNGISTNPLLNSFAITVNKYQIPRHLIDSFMASMRADLTKKNYENYIETDDYIYGSAKVVGLMCLKVFIKGDEEMYKKLELPAMFLGSAFQKVNFLRDLRADFEDLDRTYFHNFDKNSFNDETKMKIIEDIEQDFKLAKEGIKMLPGQAKLAVWIAYKYYLRLLHVLKRTPADKLIGTRIRVNNVTKIMILNQAYISYKLNLI
ncbi:MAG: phytoene/squalene synthase family protein [Prolixibacteraceae bacterium]